MSEEAKVVRLAPSKVIEKYNELGVERGYPSYPEGLKLRGFVDRDSGTIFLETGASKTREFHEKWHFENPHGELSPKDLVDIEIKAELSAYNKVHRHPNVRVGIPAVAAVLTDFPEKYNVGKAVELVVRRLRHFGVDTNNEDLLFLKRRFGG